VVQIQWYEEVALVRDGKVLHVLSASGSRGVLPRLHSLSPLAVTSAAATTVKLIGSNIAAPDNTVLSQSQGEQSPSPVQGCPGQLSRSLHHTLSASFLSTAFLNSVLHIVSFLCD
jgi:hypothetical protein